MTREEKQSRHEKLVDFINELNHLQSNGNGALKKVAKQRTSDMFASININDINRAVTVVVDLLNLSGGSVTDVDLYQLLQAYFLIPDYREKFNSLVSEAKTFKYQLEHCAV